MAADPTNQEGSPRRLTENAIARYDNSSVGHPDRRVIPMELNGTIHEIFDEKAISASFRKREFVLVTEDKYPQKILVEMTQDKIALLDNFKAGDNVVVSINIRGREWKSPRGEVKYFVSINGWKMETPQQAQANGPDGPDGPSGFSGDAPPPGFDDAPIGNAPSFDDAAPSGGAPPLDDDIPF